jgi:hypothetical protein
MVMMMRVLSLNLLLLAGIGAPPSLNLSLMLFRADILLVMRVIILQQAQTLFATGTVNFLLRNVSAHCLLLLLFRTAALPEYFQFLSCCLLVSFC